MEQRLTKFLLTSGRLQYRLVLKTRENKEKTKKLQEIISGIKEWKDNVKENSESDEPMTYIELKEILDRLHGNFIS